MFLMICGKVNFMLQFGIVLFQQYRMKGQYCQFVIMFLRRVRLSFLFFLLVFLFLFWVIICWIRQLYFLLVSYLGFCLGVLVSMKGVMMFIIIVVMFLIRKIYFYFFCLVMLFILVIVQVRRLEKVFESVDVVQNKVSLVVSLYFVYYLLSIFQQLD